MADADSLTEIKTEIAVLSEKLQVRYLLRLKAGLHFRQQKEKEKYGKQSAELVAVDLQVRLTVI